MDRELKSTSVNTLDYNLAWKSNSLKDKSNYYLLTEWVKEIEIEMNKKSLFVLRFYYPACKCVKIQKFNKKEKVNASKFFLLFLLF